MPSAKQEATKPSPIYALTGMRFFAALVVVVVHCYDKSTGSNIFGPAATNAVTFFFVLSGFILTYVYHERIARIGTLKFYIARFARIWPLHVVCFVLTLWVDWRFGSGGLWNEQDWLKMGTHLGLVQSWIPIERWAMRYNGPAWSISTELGFYLLFPLLLWVAKRGYGKMLAGSFFITATIVVLIQIAVVSDWFGWYVGVEFCYINPIVRVFDFAVGMWVASLFLRRKESLASAAASTRSIIRDTVFECLALALTVFLFYLLNYGVVHEYLATYELIVCKSWLARGGAVMPGYIAILLVFSTSKGLIGRFLSKPLVVYLGEISFALYLVQIAVLLVMENLFKQANLPTPYFMLITILLAIGLSMLLHSIVEMPLRQFLVSMANFDRKKVVDSFSLCWRGLNRNGVGLIGVSVCLFAMGLIWYESKYPNVNVQNDGMMGVVSKLRGNEFKPVVFADEATLHLLNVVENEETVDITMWWQLGSNHRRMRFMHFSNEAGDIVHQGYSKSEKFVGSLGGSFVLDKVSVKKSDITSDTKYFGVGFWSKAAGACPADSGKRQMEGHRLIIAEVTPDAVKAVGVNSAN